MSTRRDDARALIDRLHRAYCKPGNVRPGVAFLTEVPSPGGHRRADALAVHLTRSKPWIDGIEVKVHRSDWLAELDQHTKADAWFPHTHRWWVAVPATGRVVDPAELPVGWGLMAPDPRSPRRMKTVVAPAKREPDLPYEAVVEIVKKLDNQRADQVNHHVSEARQQLEQDMRERERTLREQFDADPVHRRDREAAHDVATALDMPLSQLRRRLQHPDTAACVRAALAAAAHPEPRDDHLKHQLQETEQRYTDAATALRTALTALERRGGAA